MKNRDTYLIYLLSLIILLGACRKEEVILDDPIVIPDPPIELDGLYLSGQISDNEGALVDGAVIRFYQQGALIGETITDENGHNSTTDLPLVPGQEITYAIEEETYAAKYKRTDAQVQNNSTLDLRVIKKNAATPGQDEVLANPGDTTLVKLYGTFTDYNGDPIVDAHALVAWEFEKISDDRLGFEGVYDLTDENGYVELLAPEGVEAFFFSLPNNIDNGYCIDYISEEEENVLDWGLYFDNLGVITEEQELIEQAGLNFDSSSYSFYGEFRNCDGSPVTSGEAKLRISYVDRDTITRTYTTTEFGPGGEYAFDFDLCNYAADLDIELSLVNQDTFGAELIITAVSYPGMHFAPINACDDLRPVVLSSVLNLNIGTDYSFNVRFDNPPIESSNFTLAGTHDEISGFILFKMQEVTLGENLVEELHVGWLFTSDPFSFSTIRTLVAEITQFSNGEIIGTLSGSVDTRELGTQEVTGDFIVRYE